MKASAWIVLLGALGTASVAYGHSDEPEGPTQGRLLASGLMGTIGGTIGPDGALYIPQGALGKITRIDPSSGKMRTFASGLPLAIAPIGGAVDVAFIGKTAYVLVTLVGTDVGSGQIDGIYRVDGRDSFTVIADIGAFALANPPPSGFSIFLNEGVQYALQPIDDGFLVTDGHHNRVLHVTLDGDISVLKQFLDVVPTGMATTPDRVYLAETGPVPHAPATGKVASFDLLDPDAADQDSVREVASGFSMIVDVEFGPDGKLYALSQGDFSQPNVPESAGLPADPNTGRLLRVNNDGTFTLLADKLDRPTSLHFACGTPYIVTLTGEIWRLADVSAVPNGAGGHGSNRD